MVIRDCRVCDGVRPKGCPHCGGTGSEPPTKKEKGEMLERAIITLERPGEFE